MSNREVLNKSTLQPYAYDRYSHGRGIRLLKLEPGEGDQELACMLQVVSHSDKPEYAALSYVWGQPLERRTLTCSGGRLEITDNLYSALVQLQPNNHPVSF